MLLIKLIPAQSHDSFDIGLYGVSASRQCHSGLLHCYRAASDRRVRLRDALVGSAGS